MAKKLTLSDLDFSRAGNTPDWAAQLRLDYENEQNKEREVGAQALAVIEDFASRGEPLTPKEETDLFSTLQKGEEWVRPPRADFSGVQDGSANPSPVVPQERTFLEGRMDAARRNINELGAVLDTAQASVQDAAAGALLKGADSPQQIQDLLRVVPGFAGAAPLAGLVLPGDEEEKQSWMDASTAFANAAQANRDLADPIKEEAMARGGEAWRQYTETVFDVAGSPSSAASLIGGPAAALPFADVYLREYGAARRAGLTPEEADQRALGQAIPEGVISIIPSGKLLGGIASRVPGVRGVAQKAGAAVTDSLESRMGQAINTAIRATTTGAGEGLEEGVTFMVQDAASRVQGLVGSEKAREYALKNVTDSEDYWSELWRNARAGAAMGAPIGGLEGAITGAREGGRMRTKREEDLSGAIDTNLGNTLLAQRTDADLADLKTDTELNQDIAFEQQRIADEEAKQQAFEQAEKESTEQRGLEEEAGFQTLERANTPAGTVVERTGREGLADVVERVPAEPVRPEAVAEQRAAEQRAAAEQAERVRQGKLTEELRKRREAAAKKQEGEQKKQTRAQRLAEKKRRDFIADQVLSENPDATEAELTAEYESRLADETIQPPTQAAAKPEPTLEARVQNVRDNIERAQKGKVTRMQTERIKAVVRRNPDLSVDEIANQLRAEGQVGAVPTEQAPAAPIVQPVGNKPAPDNVIPAPTKTDKSQTEQELDSFADKMGLSLGMAQTNASPSDTASTIETFKPKAKTFVKALVGRTSKDSRDVQTLIRQGKIVVAPNAATVGRTEAGRQAEYDMGTGKMYLYLDNMADLNDPVGHIAAALHEANHALLTEGEVGAAAGKIRTAANKGNKLAQAAVRKAQADTDARAGDTTFENEEVVAYFASETKAAEGKPLGSVGAVVRDLTSAAKGAIRKHTGLDLNVSIGEVATALNAALGDATTREIAGRDTDGSLAMIAGPSATSFRQKQTRGETYTGARDQGERFEIPDNRAELTDSRIPYEDLKKGNTVKLDELLSHDALFTEYPQLGNISVVENDQLGTANGQYDPETNTISIAPHMLLPNKEEALRKLILHETQHAIQNIEGFVPGASSDNFIPRSVVRAHRDARDKITEIIRNFDLGRAVQTLNPVAKKTWSELINSGLAESRDAQAQMFLEEDMQADSSDRMIQRYGDVYKRAIEAYDEANDARYAAEQEAFQTYLRDYGETEARNTEFRSRMTPEELAAQAPESTMGQAPGGIPVERTLDTTPFVGGARRPPQSLGMAASQTPKAKAERRDPVVVQVQTWTRNLFQNSKGLGPEILEAFEFAKSSPAGEEARANNSLGKYNAALRELAKQRGVTMEALNDEIMQELDAIDNQTNGYDANIAAYKAVVGKYGQAGQHLLALRNQVDALTKEMLRQRAAANVKPTAAEAKQLTTLINNSGRYSHRLYAAYQGKAGKKYANAIMSVYEKGRKGKKLTPAQQDTYDMVERALKTLIDDSLMIPDDAAIAEMGGDQLIRLYKSWGKHKTDAVSLDELRDELARIRDNINGDTDRLRVTAEGIAADLLDLTNSDQPISTYYRGSKQDRGILQERVKIPANIRALMGEITDPGTRLLATVAKQAEFVARTKFLLEVKNKVGAAHLQPPNATGTPAVVNNSMQKLEGEGYGPLDGWFASPQLRSMLVDVRESLANFEQVTAMAGTDPGKLLPVAVDKGLEKWMQIAGISKRAQIVGNLFLQPLNWTGALFMPLVNGNINPAAYGRGLLDAKDLIRYARNPSLGLRGAEDAVTYGITDSATIGELKGLPYEKIQDFARTMAGKSPSKSLRFLKEVGLTLQESYAMMDVWAKIANFHNEVNQLTSYYKKNGETRTEEQIKREAADITNRTNITYKRAVPIIKALERGGITNFGTYFYEVFRSQIGNFAQGVQEMTTGVNNAKTASAKAAKLQRGMTRVGGQAAYWTAAAQVSSMLSQMMFGDDEDEWDKRSLLPEYMQNQDLFPVGLDEKGEPVLFSVSRVDAIGPATDIMRQAMTGGLSMEQAKDEVLNLYVRPRIVPQLAGLVKTLVEDTAPTKQPIIRHLAPEGYEYLLKGTNALGVQDKSTKAWVNLVEAAFGPGTYNAYRETNPTPVAPIGGNDSTQQLALVAKYIGATFTKLDPDSAVFFANKDYEDTIKIGRKDLANAFKDRPNITDDEIVSFVNEAKDAEEAKWNELARIYRGMKAFGMKDADINGALKNAKMAASTIKSIKSQQFDSGSVSKASFEQQINRELSKLNDEDKKAFKANWEKAWKRLDTVSKENRQ